MEKDKKERAVQSILSKHDGEMAILLADHNHSHAAERAEVAFNLARASKDRGIGAVGLEVHQGTQAIFDALESGKITKQEFLNITKEGYGPNLTPQFFKQVANFIQDGGKVIALDTGVDGSFNRAENLEKDKKITELESQEKIDYEIFQRTNQEAIDQDSKSFANTFLSEQEKKLELSKKQKQHLKLLRNHLDDGDDQNDGDDQKKDYKNIIRQTHKIGHATTPELHLLRKQIGETHPPTSSYIEGLLSERMPQDQKIAKQIQDYMDRTGQGMIVLFGAGHFLHQNDIDANLRKNGITPMIVDLELGEKDQDYVHPLTRKIERFSDESIKEEKMSLTAKFNNNEDPHRYRMPNFEQAPDKIEPVPIAAPVPLFDP